MNVREKMGLMLEGDEEEKTKGKTNLEFEQFIFAREFIISDYSNRSFSYFTSTSTQTYAYICLSQVDIEAKVPLI